MERSIGAKGMNIYKFYDTDITGREEYDIIGSDYVQLLNTCFQYCTSVAMCICLGADIDVSEISPFQIQVTPEVKKYYHHYGHFRFGDCNTIGTYKIVHYSLTPEVKAFLFSHADSVFKWTFARGNNNPDDLVFFRHDGTAFFSSVIHEGECTLHPRDNENISIIVSDPRWLHRNID
jgi:hypothetical protein